MKGRICIQFQRFGLLQRKVIVGIPKNNIVIGIRILLLFGGSKLAAKTNKIHHRVKLPESEPNLCMSVSVCAYTNSFDLLFFMKKKYERNVVKLIIGLMVQLKITK